MESGQQAALKRQIAEMAARNNDIDVVWLYGSRATNQHTENSDIDLAVAFRSPLGGYEGRLRAEELAMGWRENGALDLSVVDIALAPAPLAISIISDGQILLCKNDLRLHKEEQKVWSKWEAYKYAYEQFRT